MDNDETHFLNEERFHDDWASTTRPEDVDVVTANEAITAPEMRFITQQLGDLRGKRLLDVGCGLGEASVYFATKGANVVSTDLSGEMLTFTKKLGERYEVSIETHKSTAESLCFENNEKFDVIYVGNLFHHVDIESTIQRLIPLLEKNGTLVSWDPLAYNPLINIYRKIASGVRTVDEHPLRLRDVRLFSKYFTSVHKEYFWFTTLVIFIIMAIFQGRNPNKERYWKKVVEEGPRWAFLYKPLEKLDKVFLSVFPFLKPLCWNVVIVAKNPVPFSEKPNT